MIYIYFSKLNLLRKGRVRLATPEPPFKWNWGFFRRFYSLCNDKIICTSLLLSSWRSGTISLWTWSLVGPRLRPMRRLYWPVCSIHSTRLQYSSAQSRLESLSAVCLSLCLSVLMSVCPYVCLSLCLSVLCLSVLMSVCPDVCLFLCLSVLMSVCPYVCLSLCLSVHMSVCPYVCLSFCLSVLLSLCLFLYFSISQSLSLSLSLYWLVYDKLSLSFSGSKAVKEQKQ